MKVILLQDVNNLGEEGDILEVAPGYARNYLLPRKLVNLFNTQNLATLEAKKSQIEKKKEAKRQTAAGEKEKISSLVISLKVPAGENGKLFGSVGAAIIADELAKHEIQIERKRIEVPGHIIKSVGDYKVHVRLYGNESAELKVTVQGVAVEAARNQAAPAPARIAETPVEATPTATEDTTDEAAE